MSGQLITLAGGVGVGVTGGVGAGVTGGVGAGAFPKVVNVYSGDTARLPVHLTPVATNSHPAT
jgi:hypothetical protein